MKKIITTITALLTLTACYRDLGDYDYAFDRMDQIEEVTLSPEPDTDPNGDWILEFTQPMAGTGTRTDWIKAEITHKFQDQNTYVCHWQYGMPIAQDNGTLAFKDTTITADSIPVMFLENTNTSYEIMLIVEDVSDSPAKGIKQYYSITASSVPPYKNSLMVLHGKAGSRLIGNIDDNRLPGKMSPDIWKDLYGNAANPFKTAVNIYDNSSYHDNGNYRHSLFVATYTGSAYIYNSYGLVPLENEYWTYPQTEDHTIIPKQIGKYNPDNMYGFMIDQSGVAYVCGRAFKMQFFEIGSEVPDNTEGHIKKGEYEAECGIMYENYLLFWDKKGNRFLTTYYMGNQFPSQMTFDRSEAHMTSPMVDAGIDFQKAGIEAPENMSALYGYISCDGANFGTTGYMIFADANNNAYAYRLEINDKNTSEESLKIKSTRAYTPVERFRVTDRVQLTGLKNFTSSSPIVYYSQLDPSFFYYASGAELYRYNMTNQQAQLVYTAPEGYRINVLKFRCATHYSHAGSLPSILDIGMNKNDEGAIATIKLTNSGTLDQEFEPRFYTGFGPIADIAFAHEYIYEAQQFN